MLRRYLKNIIIGFVALLFAAFIAYLFVLKLHYVPAILAYHRVEVVYTNEEKLTVSKEAFAKQMEFLLRNKYNVVSLKKLVEYINDDRKIPPKTVTITFDDGSRDNFVYAFPVLKKYNFPATIFMISDYVDTKPGYLSSEELKILSENNITIGSHTQSHRRLIEGDIEEITREVKESKQALEEIIGRDLDFISYPYGAFDDRVIDAVKESGYKAACTTSLGRSSPDWNIYALKRCRVSPSADNLLVFGIVSSGYYTFIKEMRDED